MKFLSYVFFACLLVQGSMVFAAQQSVHVHPSCEMSMSLPLIQQTSYGRVPSSHCTVMNLALEQLIIKKSQQRLQTMLAEFFNQGTSAQIVQATVSDATQDAETTDVSSGVTQNLIQKRTEHRILFERYCREGLFNHAADEMVGMVQTYEPQLVQQASQELLAASQFFISKNENLAAERLLQQCSFLPVERKNEIAELRACMAPAPIMIQPNNNNQRKIVTAKRHNK